ncbi:MAG: hypothetical protein H6838_15855 [Planctomycetes bacterium]|nr:hypothetical protein [Planctomycetota bacterium]MCB9886967.1 hypothetical protein [Planctomycetota bacterium]
MQDALIPRNLIPLLSALAGLAAAGAAQDAQAQESQAALPRQRIPIHTAMADAGAAYGIWGAGADYKVGLHEGMTFVPYLGADYPQTQPWRWRTVSVRIGETELVTHAPELRHTDFRAEYDLGHVVEAYDVGRDGLEQTFVIARRPTSAGDLVVTGAVQTALNATGVENAHRAATYLDAAGRAILTYGAATAVDAAGRRAAMRTTITGTSVSLRLDGAWLAGASFPVTVDPLLSPVLVNAVGAAVTAVDLVHETNTPGGRLWLAFSRAAAANDEDLYFWCADSDGSNAVPVFVDVSATWSTAEPSCTWSNQAHDVVVAFTRQSAAGARSVRWHRHACNNTGLTSTFASVTTPAGVHYWRPAIGGCRDTGSPQGDLLQLVMQREDRAGAFADTTTSSIYGCTIDLGGPGEGTASLPTAILDAPLTDAERPAIQRLRDLESGWAIAYQRGYTFSLGNATWDVLVQRLGVDGSLSPALRVDDAGSDQRHEFAPRIEGSLPWFLVATAASTTAQTTSRTSEAFGHQIRLSRLSYVTASGWSQTAPTVVLNSNTSPRVEVAGLGYDNTSNSHWGVLYHSNVTENLYFATVGSNAATIDSVQVHAASGSQTTVRGGVTYDYANSGLTIGHGLNAGASGNEVRLRRYQLIPYPLASVSGVGCTTAGINWGGSHRAGTGNSWLWVTNTPSGSLIAAIVGLAPTAQPLLGVPAIVPGCWLLVPNVGPDHLGALDLRFGPTGLWNIPLPEWLPPTQLYFQAFHSDATFSQFAATQRLLVQTVR